MLLSTSGFHVDLASSFRIWSTILQASLAIGESDWRKAWSNNGLLERLSCLGSSITYHFFASSPGQSTLLFQTRIAWWMLHPSKAHLASAHSIPRPAERWSMARPWDVQVPFWMRYSECWQRKGLTMAENKEHLRQIMKLLAWKSPLLSM